VVGLIGLVVAAVIVVPRLVGPATATPVAAPTPAAPTAAPTTAPPAAALRVMTWNVRTNEFDAPDWAPVVAEQKPDVVAFQEICAGDAEDLADILRTEYGLDYTVVPGSAREAIYETCRVTADGPVVFGQAVLSRVPVRDPVNTLLPDGGGLDETRAFLAVTLDVPGAPIRLLTTHITIGGEPYDDDAARARRYDLQAEQIAIVARAAGAAGERVVLLGDLNVGPDDPRLDVLDAAGLVEVDDDRRAPTGNNRFDDPGSAADAKIDYQFVKGLTQVGQPETYWVPSSDHRPLIATLRP
jgi:endonuclease/exonuclease/phosphatase family metal-dependent hydrolase